MYNLNVSLAAPQLLGVGPSTVSCTTPRTPEILNSVIAMTNPMDTYQQHHHQGQTNHSIQNHQLAQQYNLTDSLQPQILTNEASAGSNSDSSAVSPEGTNSVQKTCSLLIKAGLKLTIQSKRKMSGGDSSGNETSKSNRKDTTNSMDTSDDDDDEKSNSNGLTPEDEERRRRRRERNKIAATKCRMKKRERTLNLVSESEILELQNIELKNQERALETERRKLLEALQSHSTACILPGGYQAPPLLSKHNGCCGGNGTNGSLTSIKSEPTFKATSGRGRRGTGTRGRAAGRGGGGGRGGCRKVKQEPPSESPIQVDNNNLSPADVAAANTCNSNNGLTTNGLSGAPVAQLPHFTSATDPFYPKYSPMDESPSLDYYNYDGTLTSVVTDVTGNCANYLLKSPTRSIDSITTALNDLSNSSNFSYPLATQVALVNGANGGGGVGNGITGLQASPLIKNDIYIPNCENSNDLLQCTNPVGGHNLNQELYNDTDTDTKLNDLTLNGNGMVNNLSCYEESPLFSVFC